MSGSCDLKDENGVVFAVINAEFVFVYGSFGYAGSSLVCRLIPCNSSAVNNYYVRREKGRCIQDMSDPACC